MATPSETVVLAYSGRLDTSCIHKCLCLEGRRVVAYVADIGQEEDFDVVRRRAMATGAAEVHVVDLKREFVSDFIFPAIRGNAVYEGRYLLGTALARPLIARKQVEIAEAEGAGWVAHGATGKGNDQVRFELAYAALAPKLRALAPWKDPAFFKRFEGRGALLRFAKEQGIEVDVTVDKPYSTDENLFHKSYESGVLENPARRADAAMFTVTVDPRKAPDAETIVEVEFKDGTPVRLTTPSDGRSETDPLRLFEFANELGRKNGGGDSAKKF